MIKEHGIAVIGVSDSYLKTLLRDHAPSAIQTKKSEKTDKKYEEVNLLVAETICGELFLINLITPGGTFHVINIS